MTLNQNQKTIPAKQPNQISLHDMRKRSGKSGSSVARLCGTTYRSLRNWEIGSVIPNIVNIHDLLQIYGYSFYDLDLTPFYEAFHDRTNKQKQNDEQIDNPERERKQFEEHARLTNKSPEPATHEITINKA